MKKNYSRKQRPTHTLVRNLFIALFGLIAITIIGTLLTGGHKKPRYTAEQMIHDHDGDGIPDH